MKTFRGLWLSTAAMLASLGSHAALAAPADCMTAGKAGGWVSSGVISKRMFKDAEGKAELAFILTMPKAECLKGQKSTDDVGPTTTVQIESSNVAIRKKIESFADKKVMIEGRAVGASTVHHHAPIVVDLSVIDLP